MDHKVYYQYLMRRSILGDVYRKYFLYPKLRRVLNGSVLDLGCGLGHFIGARSGTAGVDVNPLNVEHCVSLGYDVKLMTEDSIPFPDKSFDCVLMDNVLEHIEHPITIIQEISRILRTEGKLIIGVPGAKGFAYDPDHKVFYDKNKLSELILPNGFVLEFNFYTPLKSSFLEKRMRQYCLFGVFRMI